MTAPIVRTVLGDVPAEELGVCMAHEHLVIDGGVAKIINPGISLQSVDDAVRELRPCQQAGVTAVVDAMPVDAGRNIVKLSEISRRTGVHLVAATGLHHRRYYGERHWRELLTPEEMAALFIADVEEGIDMHDLNGPVVRRTTHRAGLVKVASDAAGPDATDLRIFEAAARTHQRTGVAVMTHCEQGAGGDRQLEALTRLGVPPDRVVLSHTDKVADVGYHRGLLSSGANVVYDQGLRTPEQTLRLLETAVADGFERQVLLGTDGARRSLWTTHGGSPGLAALRTDIGRRVETALGARTARALWVENAARVLGVA